MPDDVVEDLMLDLLEWLAARPRPYAEVMEAWRTSCPRLPVWEGATERGFVRRHGGEGGTPMVALSTAGRAFLAAQRPAAAEAQRAVM